MAGPKKAYKTKSEWLERVVSIQRVTKVVKGGKKMSFRAVIVVGNEQGKVGVGVGHTNLHFKNSIARLFRQLVMAREVIFESHTASPTRRVSRLESTGHTRAFSSRSRCGSGRSA